MTMRNRKAIIAAFLVLALMLVGVGYAATSGTLKLTVTASSGVQDFKVLFTQADANAIVDSQTDGATVKVRCEGTYLEVGGANATMSTTQAGMLVEGLALTTDSVTVDFTITNYNNYKVKLTRVLPNPEKFNVSGGFVSGSDLLEEIIVDADSTVVYRVTVSIKADSTHIQETEEFIINFTGEAVN